MNVKALFDSGHTDEAMIILKDFLIDNQENGDAWALLSEISQDPKERAFAQEQAKRFGAETIAPVASATASAGDERTTEGALRQALELVKAGKMQQANRIADGVLKRNPKLPAAWYVKGLSAANIREYQESLHTLLELSKTNPDAHTYFERLKQHGFEEKRKSRAVPIWLVAGGVGLLSLIMVAVGIALFVNRDSTPTSISNSAEETILEDVASEPEQTCEELITNAMAVSDQQCQRIGTNEVCYGNNFIESDYIGNPEEFDKVGDVLGVSKLNWLRASPLDVALNQWGVAVFRLAANMPGTLPGQNVTFLVFGNTDLLNNSSDMSAFYFSTGIGGIKCKGVDFNGLQINTPDGSGIVFSVNGAEVFLEGDAVMSANPGGDMNISLVSGTGSISANGKTSSIVPGTYVTVPIDENLESVGQPSDAQPMTGEQASIVCQLYGLNCPGGTQIAIITTTALPVTTTETLVDTTEALVVTTQAPVVTTKAPIVTTEAPIVTTTVPPVDCSQITVSSGGKGQFTIHNGTGSPITLVREDLIWPAANGIWTTVEFGKNKPIGSPNAAPPEASITFGGDPNARTVAAAASVTVFNYFSDANENSGYTATLVFNNGCGVPATK